MQTTPATIEQGRKTKQGLRDLNYYGPRRVKDAAGDPPAATTPDGGTGQDAGPPAPLPVEAGAERALVK